jgi:hypothetical protein
VGALLRELLADGPMATTSLKAEAARRNIGWPTIERAKKILAVKSFKPPGSMDAGWYWCLPEVRQGSESAIIDKLGGGRKTPSPPTSSLKSANPIDSDGDRDVGGDASVF